MEELLQIHTYQEFKAATDKEVLNQAEGFVRLGYLLRKARDTEILRDSGYASVVEFAQGEYGLTETYVSRYIAINKRYSEGGYSPYLKERFQGYGMAKLAEMLTLSDAVVEALPRELPKAVIQEVKREVRQEQEITDLEVLLEEGEAGHAGKNSLEKWLRVYLRENEEERNRIRDWISDGEEEEWVMDILAPTGIAAKTVRIKGEGRWMLTIKGRHLPLELVNLRTNEKEEYSLKECAAVLAKLSKQEEEEAKEEKIAPVQEGEEKEGAEAEECRAEEEKEAVWEGEGGEREELKREEEKAGEVFEEGRQMEVEDYPEMLPEGYQPSSAYIQCHDGSEVEEKEWKEAEELIGRLHREVLHGSWNPGKVYRMTAKLMRVLEGLKEALKEKGERKKG